MPAWEAIAPRRLPTHNMLWRSLLPQGEVKRIALVALTVEVACVGYDILEVTTRELAVVIGLVVLLHIEVNRAV